MGVVEGSEGQMIMRAGAELCLQVLYCSIVLVHGLGRMKHC